MPGSSGAPKPSVIAALFVATTRIAIRLLKRDRKHRAIELGSVSERWLASERGLRDGRSNDVSR